MSRLEALLAIALVLAAVPGLGAVGSAADTQSGAPAALQTSDVETDAVVLRAAVDEDGDATWTLEYRVRLDDQNTTDAFESLQQDVRNNTTAYRQQFADRMRSTVAAAENATGREMAVSNVTVSTRVSYFGKKYGLVTYQFTWEGFARVDDDRLVVGDALSGFFLDDETRLTVIWPDGYERQSVDPKPDETGERSVTWVGRTDFASGQPRVAVAPASQLPVSPLVGMPLLLSIVVAVGIWYRRRDADADGPVPAADAMTTPPAAHADRAVDQSETEQPIHEADVNDDSGATETPEELLSPEERVMRLLRARGGRMKQKTVTEELDWSAARTSQVVGGLRDDGEVESFRLGRENVLKLPDEDGES